MKKCTKCKVEKPLAMFYRSTAGKDGHTSACMECLTKERRDKKEYMKEYMRYRRSTDNENIKETRRRS